MAIQDLYNKTALIIKLSTASVNDYGEPTFDETESDSFDCVLQPDKGEYSIEEAGKLVTSTHRVYCDVSIDIKAGDRLKVGVVKYEVLAVLDDGGRGNHQKIMLRLVG